LTGRGGVEVDGVGLENVVAGRSQGIDVFVEFAGIRRCVVKVADGEGDGVCSCWSEAVSPAHEVLGESHMCFEGKVEAASPVSAARGPAASYAAGSGGVGVGGAAVVGRHVVYY
jgi:hypothetical protein